MGRRKKSGSPSKSNSKREYTSHFEPDDGDASNLHENEVDAFYDEAEADLGLKLKNTSKRGYAENIDEVFGISDSDDDFISEESKKSKKKAQKEATLGDDEFDVDDATGRWGNKKKYFYGGNPNEKIKKKGSKKEDQNELDEAEAEEKESRLIQERLLQNLTDEDFMLGAIPSKEKKSQPKRAESQSLENVKLDLSKLSKKEKMRLFQRESPEFKTIVEDLDDKIKNLSERIQPVLELMKQGILPNEGPAADYIKLKYQLSVNYFANVGCYLMFKSKRADLKMHPITSRLLFYKKLLDELETKVDPLIENQIDQICNVISSDGGTEKIMNMVNATDGKVERKKDNTKRLKKPRKILQILDQKSKESIGQGKDVHSTSNLTYDEAMAVEYYGATKRKRQANDDASDGLSEVDEDPVDDKDPEGEQRRGITYEMSKNKGLQPKRSKIQRNPRVKHRKKFEKAKVRRKGQVREVRIETKKYAGEISGINKRVKKGVKIL